MHLPKPHQQNELDASFALIEAHPLGTWVCMGADGQIVNHIPFMLDRARGPCGTLRAHVARANHVWKQALAGTQSVVVFQGPQAYITPGWYPGKQVDGKVVPTWNYDVAHVHGTPRIIHDADWILQLLNDLTRAQEATQAAPWEVADAPAAYIEGLLRAVVGIEIAIERLVGKRKASQDEALQDRRGTVDGLRKVGTADAAAMAVLVEQAIARDIASGGR